MTDRYLQNLMNGTLTVKIVKKDKFDEAIEKDIQAYVDSLTFEDYPAPGTKLVTAQMKKAKLLAELKESVKMLELDRFLDTAFSYIQTDGLRYLDRMKYEALNSEFQRAAAILKRFDPSQEITELFRTLLEISDEALDSIYTIAIGAYKEEKYLNFLSIMALLTALDQKNVDYWFRMGIAAQRCGNIDLALRAFSVCIDIDPEFIAARLLSAECYLIQEKKENAIQEIEEAKKIKEILEVDPIWLDLIANLEVVIVEK
jgi:tetratricopeptide (TPR) repeat protein